METIIPLLKKVRKASGELMRLSDQEKKDLLAELAALIDANRTVIILENELRSNHPHHI